jgi:hypothetical protein
LGPERRGGRRDIRNVQLLRKRMRSVTLLALVLALRERRRWPLYLA